MGRQFPRGHKSNQYDIAAARKAAEATAAFVARERKEAEQRAEQARVDAALKVAWAKYEALNNKK